MGRTKTVIVSMLIALAGCSLSAEECDENEDICADQCSDAVDRYTCVELCVEEHNECLDAVDDDEERAEATLEILDIIFGDDD